MKPIEYGDFQTPALLAAEVLGLVRRRGLSPGSVLEPTVGTGTLLAEALHSFPRCSRALGFDINPQHLRAARQRLRAVPAGVRVVLRQADIFSLDLERVVSSLPAPVLIVGNPPWVTSARQGSLGTSNLPRKGNFERHRGIDAITGKANFDVSEWIILRLLLALRGSGGLLAMLCKTKVARRVLLRCARVSLPVADASMFSIDAAAHFGVAVDACLFLCQTGAPQRELSCRWHTRLDARSPRRKLLFVQGLEVADATAFRRSRGLFRLGSTRWRSGVKHDCAAVMEFEARSGALFNAAGERVDLEPAHLLPLLKGSDLAHARLRCSRFMLVPQRRTGDDPAGLSASAPKTWKYLLSHRAQLRGRASRVFASRPEFSVFGIGDYTFSSWKLAVPALHKALVVRVVGPRLGLPVVFDDTCYLLECRNEIHARVLHALYGLPSARALLESLVFWGDKRPIRADRLGSVDVSSLAAGHRAEVLEALAGARFSPAAIARELDLIASG